MNPFAPALPTTLLAPREEPPADLHGDASDLVARARWGDASAADALFRAQAPAVLKLLTRLLGRRQDAEDLAQETFAVALEELDDLRDGSLFAPWIRTIAVRQAHRYFRRRKLKRWLGLDRGADDATLQSFAADGATPEQRAQLAAVHRALLSLDPGPRVAWYLRHVEGEALDDVAAACECSLATVKRWIQSAHEQVQRSVAHDQGAR